MNFVYDDGGRAAAGFQGKTGDCVVRAIAVATEQPYKEVYDAINSLASSERRGVRKRGVSNARTGVYKGTIRRYMDSIGWKWTPTMFVGSGCKVHLHDGELPMGRLVVSVSKHLTAVINGVVHDTHDPQREIHTMEFNGASSSDDPRVVRSVQRRCVYGFWSKEN